MSVLNAFAVYAFALEMAWLPGQAAAGSSVETATAQIWPFRSTTVAHSAFAPFKPPISPDAAASFSRRFRAAAEGRAGRRARGARGPGGAPGAAAAPGGGAAG